MEQVEKLKMADVLFSLNPKLKGITQMLQRLERKIDIIGRAVTDKNNNVGFQMPNIVPDISGKQIVNMMAMGWTVDQVAYVSGYSHNKVVDMYNKAKGIK